MKEKRQYTVLRAIGQKFQELPGWEKIAGISLTILLGVIVACGVESLQTGILIYQTTMVTVIALLVHKYAKLADVLARSGSTPERAAPKENRIATAREAIKEKLLLRELLEELRKAQTTGKPPFDLSAWERNADKLRPSRELTDLEVEKIAACYRHLMKENAEVNRWKDLEMRLKGLVDSLKRGHVHTTLQQMAQDNKSAIASVISILDGHLKQWCEFGPKEHEAAVHADSPHPTGYRSVTAAPQR